jgi:hypothetical protein
MFCPECRAEYREGFYECADCKIPLVSELPPEPKLEFIEYEKVLTAFNLAQIALIKSLLDSENVTYYIQGEHILPYYPHGPARVMVKKDQVEMAKEILRELDLGINGKMKDEEEFED